MKKIVLLFAVLCCLQGAGFGQTYYASTIMYDTLHNVSYTAVRNWNDNFSPQTVSGTSQLIVSCFSTYQTDSKIDDQIYNMIDDK